MRQHKKSSEMSSIVASYKPPTTAFCPQPCVSSTKLWQCETGDGQLSTGEAPSARGQNWRNFKLHVICPQSTQYYSLKTTTERLNIGIPICTTAMITLRLYYLLPHYLHTSKGQNTPDTLHASSKTGENKKGISSANRFRKHWLWSRQGIWLTLWY